MFHGIVSAFGISATTLWIAATSAAPHKPLPNNEAQELAYARLLGRQQRVVLLALIVTAVAFFILIAGSRTAPMVSRMSRRPHRRYAPIKQQPR